MRPSTVRTGVRAYLLRPAKFFSVLMTIPSRSGRLTSRLRDQKTFCWQKQNKTAFNKKAVLFGWMCLIRIPPPSGHLML